MAEWDGDAAGRADGPTVDLFLKSCRALGRYLESVLEGEAEEGFARGTRGNPGDFGVDDEGIFFLQKPFSAKDLAASVRAVLDVGSADPG